MARKILADSNIPDDTYMAVPHFDVESKSVLILTADNTEDLEFFYPYYRMIEEGFRVDVATPAGGAFKAKNGLGISETKKLSTISADDYDFLYIPGGKAPEALKKEAQAVTLVQEFIHQNKMIAAICHGPQLLAKAGVIDGRRIAAWPEVKDELETAGAAYANESTVIDGPFITARWPADLPVHLASVIGVLKEDAGLQKEAKLPLDYPGKELH